MASKDNLAKRQGQYVSICCLCFESYDEIEKKPKTLSCSHTVCLRCIRGMIFRSVHHLTCPKCRRTCKLLPGPSAADSLPTDMYSLNMLKLSLNQSAQFWCLTCDAFFKPACQYAVECHKVIDLEMEKKLIQCLKKEAFEQVATAVSKREEVQEHMKVRATNLTAELQTLALDMQENSSSLEKLRPLLENYCEEIDSPSFSMSTSDLRKMIEEAKAEIKDADKFLPSHQRTMISHIEHVNTNHSYPNAPVPVVSSVDEFNFFGPDTVKKNADVIIGASSAMEHLVQLIDHSDSKEAEADGLGPVVPTAGIPSEEDSISLWPDSVKINTSRFSVETLNSCPPLLRCKCLSHHTKAVFDAAFSDDGSFLVSGGKDERLLLWPINSENPQPTEMESTNKQVILSLAVTPDNGRIYSGGFSPNVIVYDSQTAKEISFVPNRTMSVRSLSLQPESNGNIFAAACYRAVRMFDVRNNAYNHAIHSIQHEGRRVNSVMFSPVDSMQLVFSGEYGARVMDLRNLNQFVYNIRTNGEPIFKAQYKADGKSIIINGKDEHVTIYDRPSANRTEARFKMQVGSQEFDTKQINSGAFCFAGDNDEFVATSSSTSNQRNLFIWEIPAAEDEYIINRPLLILEKHQKEITRIAYNRKNCSLLSADYWGVINIWTPLI